MNEERGPWYLLTGFVIGLLLGLGYAWFLQPAAWVNTAPNALAAADKDHYRVLIASAYLANGDLVRARARLGLLGDKDTYRELAQQAQRTLGLGGSNDEARALGMLAVALGKPPKPVTAIPLPSLTLTATIPILPSATVIPPSLTPATVVTTTGLITQPLPTFTTAPTLVVTFSHDISTTATLMPIRGVSLTPTPTGTRPPIATASITPGAPLALKSSDRVCDAKLAHPLLQISAYDSSQQPIAGIGVNVSWDGGEATVYTGLKPEISLGYADLTLTPGITYTVRLTDGGQPITGLATFDCTDTNGKKYQGSWQIIFNQP
jgi:hypothetical protein